MTQTPSLSFSSHLSSLFYTKAYPQENDASRGTTYSRPVIWIQQGGALLIGCMALVETLALGVLTVVSLLVYPVTPRPCRFFAEKLYSSSFTIYWNLQAIRVLSSRSPSIPNDESSARFSLKGGKWKRPIDSQIMERIMERKQQVTDGKISINHALLSHTEETQAMLQQKTSQTSSQILRFAMMKIVWGLIADNADIPSTNQSLFNNETLLAIDAMKETMAIFSQSTSSLDVETHLKDVYAKYPSHQSEIQMIAFSMSKQEFDYSKWGLCTATEANFIMLRGFVQTGRSNFYECKLTDMNVKENPLVALILRPIVERALLENPDLWRNLQGWIEEQYSHPITH